MFSNQQSKEDLEKIYNKKNSKKTNDEFNIDLKEVQKFNNKVQQDKILKDSWEWDDEQTELEKASQLLSSEEPQVSNKYSSPLQITEERIKWLRIILITMHCGTIMYFITNALMFQDLLNMNTKKIFMTDIHSDFRSTGLKVIYGSPIFSMYFYYMASMIYVMQLLICFMRKSMFYSFDELELNPNLVDPASLRRNITGIFFGMVSIYSLGLFAQLFFYNYKKGQLSYGINEIMLTERILFKIYICSIQIGKIIWSLSTVYLMKNFQIYCIRYGKDMKMLKQASRI